MKKDYIGGLIVGVLLGAILASGLTAFAQAPAAPVAGAGAQNAVVTPSAPPALDETEGILWQLVIALAQVAQNECNSLDSMKRFNDTRDKALKRIEANHPGYKLDTTTGKLVAKAPAK